MMCSTRRRGTCAAIGSVLLTLSGAPVRAQSTLPPPATAVDRWSVDAQYLHLGAAPIHRRATSSMAVMLGRAVGRGAPTRGARVEAGWLRASRVTTQAQGVTLGMSVGLPVGPQDVSDTPAPRPSLTFRPGVAVLAGWAEAQETDAWYAWRGLPNTAYAGQTGTASTWRPVRGRTTGAGVSLAADLRLSRAVALTGAVREWAFTGPVIRPNRWATLAGLGLSVRPRAFAADTRLWWREATGAGVAR